MDNLQTLMARYQQAKAVVLSLPEGERKDQALAYLDEGLQCLLEASVDERARLRAARLHAEAVKRSFR